MSDQDSTRIINRRSVLSSLDQTETVPLDNKSKNRDDEDGHTRLFRPTSKKTSESEGGSNSIGDTNQLTVEPVVGWLVVLNGKGKGQARSLYYGMNSIGRNTDEKVALDFEDEQISRKGHAFLTYDPRGRKFYVQHGGGTNLTYLDDVPVLQPSELKGREILVIGNTRLVFIPLCGELFDWQDL